MIINKEHLTEKGKIEIKLIQSNMNSNRKFNKKLTVYTTLEFLIFILLLMALISYLSSIINFISIYNIFDWNPINWVKGTIKVDNIKIDGLKSAVDKVRDASIYIIGMTAAAKIIKSSSLPIGAKLGATLRMGGASLIGYKMIQNNLVPHYTKER